MFIFMLLLGRRVPHLVLRVKPNIRTSVVVLSLAVIPGPVVVVVVVVVVTVGSAVFFLTFYSNFPC